MQLAMLCRKGVQDLKNKVAYLAMCVSGTLGGCEAAAAASAKLERHIQTMSEVRRLRLGFLVRPCYNYHLLACCV